MRAGTLVVLGTVLLAPASAAQTAAQTAAPTPHRRAHHAMVYDQANRVVLLSGGRTPLEAGRRFRFFNDVWAFDGTRWRFVDTSGAELSGFRLAFDADKNRVVSFGGFLGRAGVGDLRVLDAGRWRTLGTHPELTASEPGFVYDSRRKRFVMFGGSYSKAGDAGWILDDAGWTRITAAGPPPRQAHAMEYDEHRGRVVVFGGLGARDTPNQRPPILGDTWEFDGARWERLTVEGPSPRASPGIAYDSKRRSMILFGGVGGDGTMLSDTWSWDGRAWKLLAQSGPEPRAMGYLAYDRHRDRIVLFGGRRAGWPNGDANDTWEWDGAAWRRAEER
jgi:hypothetical protein